MPPNLSEPVYNPTAGFDPYPETHQGWVDVYNFRWDCYLQQPYGAATQKNEHLFRAFDDSGNEIDQTRRVFRWYSFIVDTDARALAPGMLVLELEGEAKNRDLLVQGERIWKRSRFRQQMARNFTKLCALGDCWIEAVRTNSRPPYDVKLVWYDPRSVNPVYDDETGAELVKVVIETGYLEQIPQNHRMDETLHTYKRILTRDRIEVYKDGELQAAQSGPHGLGVVPCVHLQAIPWDQPEHSLPAPAGVERALMKMDSISTQVRAIGNRYANPTLITYGFKVGGSSDVQRFGRMIDGAPVNGKAEYVEAEFSSIPALLDELKALDQHIRDTSPEVLFASDAARESAEARSLRANAFELKISSMRAGVYESIAEVTGYALALEANQKWGPTFDVFHIDAPPILPKNLTQELDLLQKVKPDLTRADYIRHLQRLGFVPDDVEPEAYAKAVDGEDKSPLPPPPPQAPPQEPPVPPGNQPPNA